MEKLNHSTPPCVTTRYNRATKCFDVYAGNEYIGSRETPTEARALADNYTFNLLNHGVSA